LAEMIVHAEEYLRQGPEWAIGHQKSTREQGKLSAAEFRRVLQTIFKSSPAGIGVGLIPGLGPTVASFLTYALAKKTAKPGDRFGEGELKGVAAAETADNAVVPASLIPLF